MPNWLILLHTATERPANFTKWLKELGQEYKTVELWRENIPGDLGRYNAMIMMGGVMSVNEETKFPFLTDELALIQSWLETGKPLLGICLGAQLIAKALGARVYQGKEPEIGWFPVQFNEQGSSDVMFQPFSPQTFVFQWHYDTFDLPTAGVLQASSEKYENQAFKTGENAYGLQFHPEMDESLIRAWVKAQHKKLLQIHPELPQKILTETKIYLNGLEKFGQHIIQTLCNKIG